jgi:hypothetical protein
LKLKHEFLLLVLLLPLPARFSLQIPVFLLFNLIVLSGTLFNRLMVRFHQEKIHTYGTVFFAVFVTVLSKQLLVLFSPVIALMLALPFFAVMFCAIEVGDLLDLNASSPPDIKTVLWAQLKKSLPFSTAALALALIRELLAYQSLSLPSPNGMIELAIPRSGLPTFSVFWASIPGCLVLFALLFALKSFIVHNARALREGEDD